MPSSSSHHFHMGRLYNGGYPFCRLPETLRSSGMLLFIVYYTHAILVVARLVISSRRQVVVDIAFQEIR